MEIEFNKLYIDTLTFIKKNPDFNLNGFDISDPKNASLAHRVNKLELNGFLEPHGEMKNINTYFFLDIAGYNLTPKGFATIEDYNYQKNKERTDMLINLSSFLIKAIIAIAAIVIPILIYKQK